MTPYQQARLVYESEPCARTFDEDLALHLEYGYVVSTPQAFAMVRPVMRDWSYRELADPSKVAENPDCWWIWMLTGDFSVARRWLPNDLPWIGFERKNVPRFYPLRKFICKAGG